MSLGDGMYFSGWVVWVEIGWWGFLGCLPWIRFLWMGWGFWGGKVWWVLIGICLLLLPGYFCVNIGKKICSVGHI